VQQGTEARGHDAMTGKIASKVIETPNDQAKEAAADMQQPKP
jgi:hypothetical protein